MRKSLFILLLLLGLTACVLNNNMVDRTNSVAPITNSPIQITQTPRKPVTRPGNIEDGGFISGDPCGAPCFYGITPGVTSEDDALGIVEKYDTIFGGCTIDDQPDTGNYKWVLCGQTRIGIVDGIVFEVDIYPIPMITLQQVLTLFGEPNKMEISYSFYLDYPSSVFAKFYFDSVNMLILTMEQDGDEINIDQNTLIEVIAYFSESAYEEVINLNYTDLIPWDGYRTYDVTEQDF